MSQSSIVLLPGLLCDAEIWSAQIAGLGGDHEVFCPGFLDHDSIEAMAEDVLSQAPATFALAGHSMGGRVALEVVRRAPERVERLALLDTGYRPAKPGESGGRHALIKTALEQGMEALAHDWLPPMVAPHHAADSALMARLTAMVARATPALFQRQTNALLTRPDAQPVLKTIGCATALIVGRLDGWSPLAQHEEMAALIPDATLTVIEDSGHMSPVEQPQAVSAALLAWMSRSGRISCNQWRAVAI